MKNNFNFFRAGIKLCCSQKFLTMKISVLLLFLSILQVMGKNSYSQDTPVSLDLDNVKIEQVLNEIENQSDYYFLYNEKLVNVKQVVDVNVKKEPIKEVLSDLFAGTNVDFVVVNNQILLSPRKLINSFYVRRNTKANHQQQKIVVTGNVTDDKGNSMPGVTIIIKGTNKGTVTDANGKYSITVDDSNSTLVFSFIGFHTQEVPVNGQTTLDVQMNEDVLGLDEVVVVGYGTQKKINLTGAVSTVSGKKLADRPVSTVSEAIQGVVPNLNITTSLNGGEPGASKNWNIRGLGNLNGNDAPLILVDGVQMNPDDIDPESIESVSVLKDAASAAIYGSRAPYGVVLITTKKGRKNEKISISYSGNFGWSSPTLLPHSPFSVDWTEAINEASVNAGMAPPISGDYLQRIKDYAAGKIKDEVFPQANEWRGNSNHDWMSELFYKKQTPRQKNTISLNGGSQSTNYFISTSYFHQVGELNWANDYYHRFNILANVHSDVTKWLRFDFSSKFANSETQFPNSLSGYDRSLYYHEFLKISPISGLYLPEDQFPGEFASSYASTLKYGGKVTNTGNEFIFTLGGELEPVKGWKTDINYNVKYNNSRLTNHEKAVYLRLPDSSFVNISFPITAYKEGMSYDIYHLLDVTSAYEKNIKKHYFKIMLGYEQELQQYNGLNGYKRELVTDEVPSISTAVGEMFIDDNMSHWATMAYFGRFNYNYDSKYLFEFNARYNGSSRFEESKRWGFFPSASIGYNISKEAFWEPLSNAVSNMKLRASWGSLGNQNVANYLYIPILPIRTQLPWIMGSERPVYTLSPNLISSNLTWETITTLDFGLDAGFLKNRLGFIFDWYKRTTTDMFGPAVALPYVLGTVPPQENNADMETKGWELSLSWSDATSGGLRYNLRFILSDYMSKVTRYNNPTNYLGTWYEGQTIGEIWGLTTNKIYQSDEEATAGPDQSQIYGGHWGAGDIGYKDLDGDGVITHGDWTVESHGDYSVIGNSTPRYSYGFTGGLSWKGIDFNIFIQGVAKHDIMFDNAANLFWGWVGNTVQSSIFKPHLDYWRPADETNSLGPNTDAYFPKPYASGEQYKNTYPQTRYIQHAAYMRLKNIQVGYTIPQKISQKAQISNIRLYMSAENILTFTKLIETLDPEALNGPWGTGKTYPLSKTISFGVNVTF